MTVEAFQPEKIEGDSSDVFVLQLRRPLDVDTRDRLRDEWHACWARAGRVAPVLAILGPDVSLERVSVRRQMTAEDIGMVEHRGSLLFLANPSEGVYCFDCTSRSICRDDGNCRLGWHNTPALRSYHADARNLAADEFPDGNCISYPGLDR